jgi:hypothetical protein
MIPKSPHDRKFYPMSATGISQKAESFYRVIKHIWNPLYDGGSARHRLMQ